MFRPPRIMSVILKKQLDSTPLRLHVSYDILINTDFSYPREEAKRDTPQNSWQNEMRNLSLDQRGRIWCIL